MPAIVPFLVLAQGLAAPSTPADALLTEINRVRSENMAGGLRLAPKLNEAAEWLAKDMAAKGYFSHTDSLGRRVDKRVDEFGYHWSGVAENLALGFDQPDETVKAWFNSPGHKRNMLGAKYRECGIAFAKNGQGQTMTVLVLARPMGVK